MPWTKAKGAVQDAYPLPSSAALYWAAESTKDSRRLASSPLVSYPGARLLSASGG